MKEKKVEMNVPFLMEILKNPQNFTVDQRKIAVHMALELLDTMEFKDPMDTLELQKESK